MNCKLVDFLLRAFNYLIYRLALLRAHLTRVFNSMIYRGNLLWVNLTVLFDQAKLLQTNPNGTDYFSKDSFPLVSDSELGVWNRPNHHFIKQTVMGSDEKLVTKVWFDSRGIRVQENNPNILDQVDILVTGESNTWGQGVAYENTYAAFLGVKLGLSVANLGLIGSNGVQSLLLVRRYAHLQPKLIVYSFWEEHFSSNIRRCPNIDSPVCLVRPIIKGFASNCLRISFPRGVERALRDYLNWYRDTALGKDMPLLNSWYWRLRIAVRGLAERYFDTLTRGSSNWKVAKNNPSWNNLLNASLYILSEVKVSADSIGAKTIIVYMPIFFMDIMYPPPIELREHVENLGAIFVDMEPIWRNHKNNGKKFYFEKDMHLNHIGHSDVANAIALALNNEIF